MVISTLFLILGTLHVAARLLSPAPEVLQDENFSELAAWPDAWGVVNKVVWVSQCVIFSTVLVRIHAGDSPYTDPFLIRMITIDRQWSISETKGINC